MSETISSIEMVMKKNVINVPSFPAMKFCEKF